MADDVVRVARTLPAGPAEVFASWTDARRLSQWLCPEPGHVVEASCHAVVGGTYRLVMQFPGGRTEISGTYLVVDPPHHLVFTWRPNGDPARESQVSVSLRANGSATDMTIVHERATDEQYRLNVHKGWTSVARRLSEHLRAAPAAAMVF
jgi:uncharacterized protein YndB with AHSA1/START domain